MDMSQITVNTQLVSWDENKEVILRRRYPLHHSCRDGNVEVVAALIGRYSLLEEDNFYRWTPLHWASYFGQVECLQKILSVLPNNVGVDLKALPFLQTPAHVACIAGHSKCLLCLLHNGANSNVQDYLGESPLHKASRNGSMECMKLLLAMGAEINLLNNNGQSSSQLALSCFHPEVSTILNQAELCGHQIDDSNCINSSFNTSHKENAFNGNVVTPFPALSNGHSPFTNGNGITQRMTNGRKRSIDHFDSQVKRIRTEVPEVQSHLPSVLNGVSMAFSMTTLPAATSSILEHNSLRTMEQGYHQAVLESFINQVHGC